MSTYVGGRCGHSTRGFSGESFVCDLRPGHGGFHAQHDKLRDHTEVTNWGDDGKATWATKSLPPVRADLYGWGAR